MKGWFLYWAWGGALATVLLVITVVVYQAATIPPNFARAVARAESPPSAPTPSAEAPFSLRTPTSHSEGGEPIVKREPDGEAGAFRPPDGGRRYLTLLVDALDRERERDPARVRAVLEELRRLDAPDPRVYRWLGSRYHQEGDYPAAEAAFERAVELRPDYAPDLFNLATIYLLEERYPRAIRTFNRVIPLQPPFLDDVYAYLGYCLHAMGEERAARRAWNLSLQLDPGNAVARRYLTSEGSAAAPQGDGRVTAFRPSLDRPPATGPEQGEAGADRP